MQNRSAWQGSAVKLVAPQRPKQWPRGYAGRAHVQTLCYLSLWSLARRLNPIAPSRHSSGGIRRSLGVRTTPLLSLGRSRPRSRPRHVGVEQLLTCCSTPTCRGRGRGRECPCEVGGAVRTPRERPVRHATSVKSRDVCRCVDLGFGRVIGAIGATGCVLILAQARGSSADVGAVFFAASCM